MVFPAASAFQECGPGDNAGETFRRNVNLHLSGRAHAPRQPERLCYEYGDWENRLKPSPRKHAAAVWE